MEHRYIRQFGEVGAESVALVGGKGANLGELVRAGLPVPAGFCLTVGAYRCHVDCHRLRERIQEIVRGVSDTDRIGLEERAAEILQLFATPSIPQDVLGEMASAYGGLRRSRGDGLRVAVRSSATAEDMPGASFAGQQDTYLNVIDEETLQDSVKRCWASLWTARAISYRQVRGFSHGEVELAVVVQELFPSEVSGVLFTANPVTADMREMIINSSWGLGEAIVSGRVNPDQYVVDKDTLKVKCQTINDKILMIMAQPDGGGTVEVQPPAAQRSAPSLTSAAIQSLGAIGKRIEEHYGYPQDIEWGYAGDRLAILQARPITGADFEFGDELETWQRRNPELDDKIVWTRAWVDSFQTGGTTPLFYTIHQAFTTRALDYTAELYGTPELLHLRTWKYYKGRAYYSTEYERVRVEQWPKFSRSEDVLRFFPPSQRDAIKTMPFRWFRRLRSYIRLRRIEPACSFTRLIQAWRDHTPGYLSRFRQEVLGVDFETASLDELLQTLDKSEDLFVQADRSMALGVLDYCYMLILVFMGVLRKWCADETGLLYGALVSGLPTRTMTVQENIDVWRLSRMVAASPLLSGLFSSCGGTEVLQRLSDTADGQHFLKVLDEFLEQYGHRGGSERELMHPRWRHKPELLINLVRALLRADESQDPVATEGRLSDRREEATRKCIAILRSQRGRWFKVRVFNWLLKWAHEYIRLRDDSRFFADYFMTVRRDFCLAIGSRFVAKGLIDNKEDILFLGLDEIKESRAGTLPQKHIRQRVRARREVFAKYNTRPPAKFLCGSHAFDSDIEESGDAGAGVVRGFAASGGRVTGRARVCKTLEETAGLERGDILVATGTDPGWTPIFALLGGVVTESGGILSHATLVSREYGIPCVTGAERATQLIEDGQMITVDGDSGTVLVEASQKAA